jgi:hypothetical protein
MHETFFASPASIRTEPRSFGFARTVQLCFHTNPTSLPRRLCTFSSDFKSLLFYLSFTSFFVVQYFLSDLTVDRRKLKRPLDHGSPKQAFFRAMLSPRPSKQAAAIMAPSNTMYLHHRRAERRTTSGLND